MKLKQLFLPILLVFGLLTTSCEEILPDLSGTYSGQMSSTFSNCPGLNGTTTNPASLVINKKSNGKYTCDELLTCDGVRVEIPSNGEYNNTQYCNDRTNIIQFRIGSGGKLTWRCETTLNNGGCKIVNKGDFYK